MSINVHKTGLSKTLGQQSDTIVTDDLVGNFDPSTGVEALYWDNQVSNGENLRRYNGVATDSTSVTYWTFDGTDDYLGEVSSGYGGSPLQLNVANDFTLSAWAKEGSSGTPITRIFGLGDGVSGGLILKASRNLGGDETITLIANNNMISEALTTLDWAKWNYFAVVKKSTTFSIFINGSFIKSGTISGVTGTLSVELGRENQSDTYSYSTSGSQIGIVLIYDNDITNSQLRQNFLATHDINNARVYGGTYAA